MALVAILVATFGGAIAAEAASRADMGIWGFAVRQPIKRGETTQLKFTVKNNGPDGAHGVWVQATIPYQLQIKKWQLYGGQSCTVKGTFIKCQMGAFALEQQGTVLITVRGRKRGTYISQADVYARSVDKTQGNGEVRATIMVQ